jgi:HlyD family secretion protein
MLRNFFALFFLGTLVTACHQRPKLKGVRAVATTVESTVTTISSGTVTAEQQAVLAFGVVGRVSKIRVHLGDTVTQGQVIAELENSDLQVVADDAVREAQRSKKLFGEGLVSQVALDEAKRASELARVNLDKTMIKAPFAGVITELNLELGESSSVGSAVTKSPVRLVDLKPRIIKGDIDEVDLGKVHVGQKARVRIPAAGPSPFTALVRKVVPYVDTTKEQDRTSQIELTVDDAGRKEPVPVGASAEIEIVIDRKEGALAVPSRLVLGSGASRYLFRMDGDRLRKTEIKPGVGNYDRLEIVGGLKEGDVVVYPSDDAELVDGLKAKVETTPWP